MINFNQNLFFKEILDSFESESILSYDIFKNKREIVEENFYLSSSFKDEDDKFFLSALLFTLTKFTYSHEILISKLYENKEENIFEKIPLGMKIDTNKTIEAFLSEVESLLEIIKGCSFNNFKENNINLPDFQYIYSNNTNFIQIPQANFSFIVENIKKQNIKIKYNASLYSKDLIYLFYDSFILILNKFLKYKDTILKYISIDPDEKIDNNFNFKPPAETLDKLFEKLVYENKDKIALIADDTTLTYDELNREANYIANSLIKKGLMIEDRVIINLNRDSRLIVNIFGVIKAGGTFILTNPNDPSDRINLIKKDSKAKFLIDNENIEMFFENEDFNNPVIDLNQDNLVCISYTSGSTGKPAGVMITHSSICDRVLNDPLILVCKENDYSILLITFNQSFVGFLACLLSSLCNGLKVVLANDEEYKNPHKLINLFKETKFEWIQLTPSFMEEWSNYDLFSETVLKNVKMIVFGGEKLDISLFKKLKKITKAKFFDTYGVSEILGYSHVKYLEDNKISVGKPSHNILSGIIDIDCNFLPKKVVGELVLGGSMVAKGYWNNDKLTNEKFIKINNIDYFKTGDLAKVDSNGEYNIIERIDTQMKIRGQRIELNEIENNVPKDLGIKKVCVAIKKLSYESILCLYFTTKQSNYLKVNEIKKILDKNFKSKLMSFMIPQAYVHLDEFPKTSSGKIKIMDLPNPLNSDLLIEEIILPETDLEKELFNFASEILDFDDFGVTNSFFSIGFTSLSLIRFIYKIFNEYGIELKINNLLVNDSIRSISNQIFYSYYSNDLEDSIPDTDDETILPFDKLEKEDKIVEKEFIVDFSLFNNKKFRSDQFFLSCVLFLLMKFVYNNKILISKLYSNENIDFSDGITDLKKIVFGMNINTDDSVETFLDKVSKQIKKLNEYESYFPTFKNNNDLSLPHFQYYYQSNGKEFKIPKSNFSVIMEDMVELKVKIFYNSSFYSEDFIQLFYDNLLVIIKKFADSENSILKNI
ncbi:MAG: non-ribosomal peptide synthetase, partial [Methanobrevibacter sp.]|nr:non-ribosomal peptide synthetase [Methanobrevibacter sp.]